MLEIIKDFYKAISIIDLIYLILTILSLINCYKKGFILSILSIAKWLLAYIITLILFPKIKPYVELMKNNISKILKIDKDLIGIKATTNERLGPEGREEGISCHSVVLLEKNNENRHED